MTGRFWPAVMLALSAAMAAASLAMVVEAFRRNDPQLVGASAICLVASVPLLALTWAVYNPFARRR